MKFLLILLTCCTLSAEINHNNWFTPNGLGMPIVFEHNQLMEFNFPFAEDPDNPEYPFWGKVGYLFNRYTPEMEPVAIEMTFRIESNNSVYVSIDPNDTPPPRLRVMFCTSETFSNQEPGIIPYEFRRWWANPIYYILGAADGKNITFYVPLTPDLWSSVFGKWGYESDGWFDYAKNHMLFVGFSFGGTSFFGHGMRLQAGSTRFILLDYRVIQAQNGGL